MIFCSQMVNLLDSCYIDDFVKIFSIFSVVLPLAIILGTLISSITFVIKDK